MLSIALAQINVTVGDIRGNARRIIDTTHEAASRGAELVVFPEMAVTGYPAEDLVFKRVFQQAAMDALQQIAQALESCPAAALVGGYDVVDGQRHNATFLIDGGEIRHRQYKHFLPNYGVFDEKRLFAKGPFPEPVCWRGIRLGVLICEDLWKPELAQHLAAQGAELLIVQNASPYETGKDAQRKRVLSDAARATGLPLIYLNLIGGQDELVFDGRSCAVDAHGNDVARLAAFTEDLAVTGWRKAPGGWLCESAPMAERLSDMEAIYAAMVLGLRDYTVKNGFEGVVIGLSGGIDSGLTAAVAVDALGADKVHGLLMPSPYTSAESIEDAGALARHLGIALQTIPITGAMQVYAQMLAPVFKDRPMDTTEENIQARIRGNLLMALSNKLGYMLVTTGNKSEMSVGYATLYGDMCGGYSVLKDVYKTTVFELARWRNERQTGGETIIPERMITKPPSAELKPDQKDEDSLPPYPVLDAILHGLIEQRKGIADLVAEGHGRETVERIARMIYVAEYKRRQSPPGVKISGMSFGRDRRYPITNRWIWQRD